MNRLALVIALILSAAPALAVTPDERLADPALEARARAISKDLRCLVCRNENIDDSNAPLAHDLRVIVRERLTAGDSDAAVKDYLVDRYGEYVLLKPRFNTRTMMLWLAPALLLAAGLFAARSMTRRPEPPPPAPLTDEEKRKLESLLHEGSR